MAENAPYLRPHGLFHYTKTGSDDVGVCPDPPAKDEAKPFHVMVRKKGVIPISYLVFARDAKHAESRIRTALATMVREYTYKDTYGARSPSYERAKAYVDGLASGEYVMYVEPYDTDLLACEVNWASNGGI